MSEDCLTTVPSDRAVEQALVALKKGAHLLKYGRRGKPKFCPFRLSTDEKILIWYSDEEERQLRLSSITKIIRGQKTTNFLRQLQPERESQSFSIIYANGQRSLDLICKDKAQADSWCLALRAVVSKSHHATTFVAPKIPRATQSCVSSPAGYIRRKRNLGLLEETIKFSQVGSLSGCSHQSNSQRRSSDDLSCSSHSFYSESSLSSMQNVTNILNPDSPSIEADTLTGYQTPMHASVGKGKSVLRDVFIWGEGAEGGYLGGLDKFPKHNEMELDALSPKQLDSIMTLDVHKISLGAKHAALVTKEGEVFCWGDGNRGRLGNKVNMDVTCPKIVDSLSQDHVKSIVCGEYQTCAVTFSGELYTWGENFYNANIVGNESYPNQWLSHKIFGPLDGVNVSLVACGEWHMAILSTSGQLFTYGNGTFGVLGHGDLKSISQPREVKSLKGLSVKSVACGPWHTAAIVEIMADHYKFNCRVGKLFTWGDADKGRLGHTDQERKLLPTCVRQLVDYDFTQVACGITLTAAVTHRGKVFTIGSADHGQLGNPRVKDKSITIVQGDLQNEFAVEISIGSYHIAVLTLSGSVYTWGKGSNGQLGLGDSYDRNCPTLVKALRDRKVESITCGYNLTAVICLHKSVSSTDQTACKGCGLGFSFTRKKHNCYNCGLLFCHSCSSKKTMDASLAPSKSKYFRVCDSCFSRLKGNSHSNRMTKLEDQSPRLFFTTHKRICDENVERGQAIATQCQMTITKKNLTENNQYHDSTYSFLNGIQRWGKVSCPVSFKSPQKKNIICEFPPSKNQISSTRPVCSQQITSRSQCPTATAMNEGFLESGNILTEEVQKLRAEVERLVKLCQTRSEKIKKYKQRTEETWSRAKEEAEKSKAAKEVIKVLTLKLRAMSENSGKELKDQTGTQLSQITSNPSPIASPAPERMNTMIVATYFPCQVGKLEDIKVASLCNSPVLFSNTLKSLSDRDFDNGVVPLLTAEELRLDSRQNGTKTPKKIEWVEKYEPGVYITFTSLPSRQKDLKRVRFSRKRFTEKEAEKWWEENEKAVYNKYEIEGYTSFNQDQTSG